MGNKPHIVTVKNEKHQERKENHTSVQVVPLVCAKTEKLRNSYEHIIQHGASNGTDEKNKALFHLMMSPKIVTKTPTTADIERAPRPTVINKSRPPQIGFQMRPLTSYKQIEVIGEGSYGKVFKAIDLVSSKYVALKYIRMENETEGFPITCMREILVLRRLNHGNIIKLNDIVFDTRRKSTYLVFEFMNNDLNGLLHNSMMRFNESNIYQITRQLLDGLQYCHSQNVVHRDLKTSNILINYSGQVKIADFGLARFWQPDRPFTNKVVSLWYRPVELLLGQEIYDFAADIWSLGCIVCEMFKRAPLFPYNNELAMLSGIFNLCGTPDANNWNVKRLKGYVRCKPRPRVLKQTLSRDIPHRALELVDRMLTLNPNHRITASAALNSSWVKYMESVKIQPMKLPLFESFEMKMKKYNYHY